MDLEAAGGLTIQTSSLNLMQELTYNQDELSITLKLEVQNGIQETMQSLSLSANQENINPNQGLILPGMSSWAGYSNQYMQLPS